MESSTYQTLKLDRDGAVLTVALNRPEVMNAANALLEIELCRFFTEVSHDPAVRVVVLTGEGKAFCAGGEMSYITEMLNHPERFLEAMNYGRRLVFAMLECTKPVIAKINGHAVGLGATLALFCDVSFAAEHAKIADPHVCLGFVAGDGGAVIWPQLIGYNRAKEYLFTGQPLLAADAERLGLINHAVPAAELDQRVREYAIKVAAMPPRAVQWTKASVNIGLRQLAHSIMDASLAYEGLSNMSRDHREAMDALSEGRTPGFTGS
jgi:enoyl-CoA hydratase/carnithine racemase